MITENTVEKTELGATPNQLKADPERETTTLKPVTEPNPDVAANHQP